MIFNTDEMYVFNSNREYKFIDNERVKISVPFCSKGIEASKEIVDLVEKLSNEGSFYGYSLVTQLSIEIITCLLKLFILLPSKYSSVLEEGFCTYSSKILAISSASDEIDSLVKGDIAIIHAPFSTAEKSSVHVTGGGQWIRTSLANLLSSPLAESKPSDLLIDLDFNEQLELSSLRMFDFGNIYYEPLKNNAEMVGNRLSYFCESVTDRGAIPILLGGDHTIAYYSIGALANVYPTLGILHFDAHPDLYSIGESCDSTINHANVFHWIRKMSHIKSIWQIGIRDVYLQPTNHLTCTNDAKIHSISSFEIATVGYTRLLSTIDDSIPWFISFDVDVLSGLDVPQTSTPVLGGLSYYPLLALFEQLFERLNIVGMEFVELGEALPTADGPSTIACRIISRFLFHIRRASSFYGNIFTP